MAVNGKQKGNSFERAVANAFSGRFKEYVGKDKGFIRNADSGSYFGGKNQNRIDTHLQEHQEFGDIICPPDFKFSIECKSYKTPPSLDAILKGEYKMFDKWIDQAETDAENANKKPMLVIKFNRVVPFVMTRIDDLYIDGEAMFFYKNYSAMVFERFLKYCPEGFLFDGL